MRMLGSWISALAAVALAAGCGDRSLTLAREGGASPQAPRRTVTLSVSMTGRDIVPPNQFCPFQVWVSGGTPPYTYTWTQSQGTGFNDPDQANQFWAKSGFAYSLTVHVTSSDGGSASVTKYVQVRTSPTCNL